MSPFWLKMWQLGIISFWIQWITNMYSSHGQAKITDYASKEFVLTCSVVAVSLVTQKKLLKTSKRTIEHGRRSSWKWKSFACLFTNEWSDNWFYEWRQRQVIKLMLALSLADENAPLIGWSVEASIWTPWKISFKAILDQISSGRFSNVPGPSRLDDWRLPDSENRLKSEYWSVRPNMCWYRS